MKPGRLFAASLLLNLTLLGAIAYLVAQRKAAPVEEPAASASRFSAAHPPAVPPIAAMPSLPFDAPTTVTRNSSSSALPAQTFTFASSQPARSFLASVATASSSSPASPALLPAEQAPAARPIVSTASGNFIHFRGMRVAVAENLNSRGAAQPTLAVDISPDLSEDSTPENPVQPIPSESGSLAGVDTSKSGNRPKTKAPIGKPNESPGRGPSYRPDPSVFSAEDDLFRTKWGWAAYDALQREAAKEAAK